jgi:hypothetical protein
MSNNQNFTNQDIADLLELLKSCNIPVAKTICFFCTTYKICKTFYCQNNFFCKNYINVCNKCSPNHTINNYCDKCSANMNNNTNNNTNNNMNNNMNKYWR